MKRLVLLVATVLALSASQSAIQSAIEDIKANRFESAYQKLDKLFFDYMTDNEYNFYLGRAALEIGKFHEAISAFERILISEPENTRARLELARAYFQSGDLTESKTAFEAVLAQNPPKIVEQKVKQFLAKINSLEKRTLLQANLMVGIGYDNNVYSTHEDDYYLYKVNDTVSPDDIKGDNYSQAMASISYKYDMGRRSFWVLNTSATLYLQKYQHETDADLGYGAITLMPTLHLNSSTTLFIPLKAEKVTYGNDNYLNTYNYGLKATLIKYDTLFTVAGNLKIKKFDEYDSKDSKVSELSFNVSRNFKQYTIHAGIQKANESKDDSKSSATDVEKTVNAFNIGINIPLLKKDTLSLLYSVKNYIYDDLDTYFGSKRFDHYQSATITYQRELKKNLFATIGSDYTDNESNHKAYDYDKNVVYVRVNYTFSK